jgi:hypothetical protein
MMVPPTSSHDRVRVLTIPFTRPSYALLDPKKKETCHIVY